MSQVSARVVYVNCSDEYVANTLAKGLLLLIFSIQLLNLKLICFMKGLVQNKFASAVNIIYNITSIYCELAL